MDIIGSTSVGGTSSGWEIVGGQPGMASIGGAPQEHPYVAPALEAGGFSGGDSGAYGVSAGLLGSSLGTVGGSWSPEPVGNNQIFYGHYSSQGLLAVPGSPAAVAPYTGPAMSTATALAAPVAAKDSAAAPAAAARPATPAARKPAAATRGGGPGSVTVKAGDSLSKLAAANGTTWQKLYELNRATIGANPNLIRPGQQLKLA